jgi:glutamate dehydrogenase
MRGVAENDGYNALVMAAGSAGATCADPHRLAVPAPDPRAVFAGLHVGDAAQAFALATKIVELFHARFDPPRQGESAMTIAAARGGHRRRDRRGAGKVDSLDEDRIVRRFVNAVQSAIRTNYYQLDKDGQPKQEISSSFPAASSTACRSRAAL